MRSEKSIISFGNREHISVNEVARRTGFSPHTIRRYARIGSISSVIIGSSYYFDSDTVFNEMGEAKEASTEHYFMKPRPRKAREKKEYVLPDGV